MPLPFACYIQNRTQAKLARHILEVLVKGGPQQFGRREHDITANTDGLCIMAVKPGQMYAEYDKIDYRRYKVADNKAMAMQYLIEKCDHMLLLVAQNLSTSQS